LKPRGILYLALPDRRLTFDRKRPPTSIRHLLEEHAHGAEGNRRAHYFEWATMVDDKHGAEAEAHTERLMLKSYSIHYHVWTPDEFLDLLVTIRREFDLNFQLVGYAAPISEMDNEFIMVLARPSGPRDVRLMPQRDVAALKARPEAMRPASLRRTLAQSPIGPPVRFVKRLLRRWVSKRFCA
jgi:hypothetical protein